MISFLNNLMINPFDNLFDNRNQHSNFFECKFFNFDKEIKIKEKEKEKERKRKRKRSNSFVR